MVRAVLTDLAIFPINCLQNVRVALQRARGETTILASESWFWSKFDDQAREYIAEVGLSDLTDERPHHCLWPKAQALEIGDDAGVSPDMLLLDEPMARYGPRRMFERISQF